MALLHQACDRQAENRLGCVDRMAARQGNTRLVTDGATAANHLTSDFRGQRSEEHTSELQSLMRISSAVFCLKKKRTTSMKPSPVDYDTTSNMINITNSKST